MDSFFSSFHITRWKELSKEERLEVLKQLEQHYAKQQGRKALEIKEIFEDDVLGYHFQGKMYLNPDLLLGEDDCYEAVNTVIHEGRHAFQTHAIKQSQQKSGSPLVPQSELNKWIINKSGGRLIEEPDYWFQPIEKDANDYAFAEVDKIYKDLEPLYGKNSGYEEYKREWQDHFEGLIDSLKGRLGENYIEKIEEKSKLKYNLTHNLKQEYSLKHVGLLGEVIEDFIHKTYPKEIKLGDFKVHLDDYLKENDYKNLDQYLKEQGLKAEKNSKYLAEFILHSPIKDQSMIYLSMAVEKMEKMYEMLDHIRKDTVRSGGIEAHKQLDEQLKNFNQKVQSLFQKQYPDIQCKPFQFSTSKVAIEIMKHNSRVGEIQNLHKIKDIEVKPSDLNKLIGTNKEVEMEL